METLEKGEMVFVLVEEALDNMAVVSVKVGARTLRGVLLDTQKRLEFSFQVYVHV